MWCTFRECLYGQPSNNQQCKLIASVDHYFLNRQYIAVLFRLFLSGTHINLLKRLHIATIVREIDHMCVNMQAMPWVPEVKPQDALKQLSQKVSPVAALWLSGSEPLDRTYTMMLSASDPSMLQSMAPNQPSYMAYTSLVGSQPVPRQKLNYFVTHYFSVALLLPILTHFIILF